MNPNTMRHGLEYTQDTDNICDERAINKEASRLLTSEEKLRLISFFWVLIEIDMGLSIKNVSSK